MALINCIECNNKLSDLAVNCPHCGAPAELSKEKPKEVIKCFECENELEVDQKTCLNCGVDQSLNPLLNTESEEQKQTPVVEIKEEPKKGKESLEKKIDQSTIRTKPKQEKSENSKDKSETKSNSTTETKTDKKTTKEGTEKIVYVKEKKKRHWFVKLIIFMVIVVGVGALVFAFLPNEVKKDLFNTMGIENSEWVTSGSLEAYARVEDISAREKVFSNQWVINIALANSHKNETIRKVVVAFKFSDGTDEKKISVNIPPQNTVRRLERVKISGHGGATYYGCEIIDAK